MVILHKPESIQKGIIMLKSLLRFAALFCCAGVFAAESALELDPNMKLKPADADGLKYLLPAEKPLRLTGFCWYGQDHVYRRLPVRPDGKLSRGVETSRGTPPADRSRSAPTPAGSC